jgi:hypothetical protein
MAAGLSAAVGHFTAAPCTAQESGPLCDRAAVIKDVGRRFGAEVGGTEDGRASAATRDDGPRTAMFLRKGDSFRTPT